MSRLNHTDIIRTIANGKQDRFLIFLDKFYYESLLQGRNTT